LVRAVVWGRVTVTVDVTSRVEVWVVVRVIVGIGEVTVDVVVTV